MPPVAAGAPVEVSEPQLLNRMRAALGPLPRPVAHPALLALTGLPGTGKSTLAQMLAVHLPACVVASDALRRLLASHPTYTPEESRLLFELSHQLCAELLRRGRNVVFDATNLQERHREELYHIAFVARSRLLVVRLIASDTVVADRLAYRVSQRRVVGQPPASSAGEVGASGIPTIDHSKADWSVYQRMRAEEEPIRRPHVVVDSSNGLDEGLRKVLRALATRSSRE